MCVLRKRYTSVSVTSWVIYPSGEHCQRCDMQSVCFSNMKAAQVHKEVVYHSAKFVTWIEIISVFKHFLLYFCPNSEESSGEFISSGCQCMCVCFTWQICVYSSCVGVCYLSDMPVMFPSGWCWFSWSTWNIRSSRTWDSFFLATNSCKCILPLDQ